MVHAAFDGQQGPAMKKNATTGKQKKGDHVIHHEVQSAQLVAAYRQMLLARLVDLKTIVLYKQNKCHFQIGVAGHEAVQVAAAQVFRPGKDWFYPYYREMALMIGLGMTPEELFLNAMNREADPNSHGRQMPMHYASTALNVVSQSSPTGTQFTQAVGSALASRYLGKDEVTYVSAGEGTCAQGDFHESLNWAARDQLPVVFVIQNNDFAISVPISEQLAGTSVYKLAAGYEGLARMEIDGTDYEASVIALRTAHTRALRGEGPSLIEAHVPRLQSHSISDNQLKYRSAEELAEDAKRCPLAHLKRQLLDRSVISKSEIDKIDQEARQLVDRAAEWAEGQPESNPDDLFVGVYTDPTPWVGITEQEATGEEAYLVDALNKALDEELSRDTRVLVFGEDVAGGKGGVFTVTAGLTDKHGEDRVFNSQLAESSIVGVAIGLATRGLKPVAEIQFGDYVWTAMMQTRNELAMMSYRSKGDFTCPAVLRVPVGGYIHGGAYHSQNVEATFAHFPGIYIAYPSNAADAKGLLKAAIRGKDPVLFLEHKGLYRQPSGKSSVGGAEDLVPFGKARIARSGSDLTVVTWGYLVQRCLTAAHVLASEGYSLEVIDLRTIVPLDVDAIFASVRKTNRVLIVHEDATFMGFGAEIAAQISETCFELLDAPVRRVGMKPLPHVPHAPALEQLTLPQQEDVTEAVRAMVLY
jgi:2-oxoisovalerate dehydrogenase E1 component